ncbi:MAG: SpoIIE family protein phosphatase [Bacteroidetes bacterium]|nr:SpoIIE family protein phosphatase [Bacteroidota bacterium]
MSESKYKNVKIMVVDDEVDLESLIIQKFRRQIRDGLYDFVFAHNGLEALTKLIEYPEIGIILSDINMPEMDGLTLLMKLKELKNPGLKTVIVSAYGDMDNIRTAMNRGAFDFLTKPISFDDLEITINKTMEEIIQVRHSMEEHDKLLFIQQDLQTAHEIQQAILPKTFPPFPARTDFDVYAAMVAAREVGGDFFDFFMIDNDRLGFVIGDVSGKGVPAAIFMAVSRTLIRATGLKAIPAAECMHYVNNLLCNESVSCMFVTVFYGILNTHTGELEYVNAGHNPPYLLSQGGLKKLEMTGGTILGYLENYQYNSSKIMLEPGDRLFLYTDGVTEAFTKQEEAYGDKRLESFLQEHPGHSIEELVKGLLQEVNDHSAGIPQSDDITLLSICFTGRN